VNNQLSWEVIIVIAKIDILYYRDISKFPNTAVNDVWSLIFCNLNQCYARLSQLTPVANTPLTESVDDHNFQTIIDNHNTLENSVMILTFRYTYKASTIVSWEGTVIDLLTHAQCV